MNMMNQPPKIPEKVLEEGEKEPFASQEWINYDNGQVGIRFSEPGDAIVWDERTYAENPSYSYVGPYVMVKTKSGNTYIAGMGMLYSQREKAAWDLEADDAGVCGDIEIGKPWEVPGVVATSDTKSVEFRYKIFNGGMEGATDGGSDPWEVADDLFRKLNDVRSSQ